MKKYCILFIFLILSVLGFSQDMLIKGVVMDQSTKEPIPQASIVVKRTMNGKITDVNGNFEFSVPKGSILEVSFVGYKKASFSIGDKKFYEVQLESELVDLDQVVIVGVSMRKKDLTGSVARVSAKEFENIPATSINQAIQGKMAGVQVSMGDPRPGGSTSIKVRGSNSLQYGTSPIYVVDGLILDGGFDLINPNDIESVDVLKDASATALYGSKGANGVVLITTKRGKSENGRVSYDAWFGSQQMSKRIKTLGSRDLYQLREDAAANLLVTSNPTKSRDAILKDIVHANNNPYFGLYEDDAYKNGLTADWLTPIVQDGFQQNHNVSFSGLTSKGSYYVSLNYADQEGLIKKSDYKRYSGKINIDQNVKPWLKVGTSTSIIRSNEVITDNSVLSVAQTANPMFAVNETSQVLKWGPNDDLNAPNPIKSLSIDWDKVTNRTFSSNYVQITPGHGFVFRSTIGLDMSNVSDSYYLPRSTFQGVQNSQNGEASQKKDEFFNWQWDNSLTYTKTFQEDHSLSVLLGHSVSKNSWNYNRAVGWGFPVDDFSYKYLDAASGNKYVYSNLTAATLLSYLGRVNYSYKNKYNATASARYDGSSKFGEGQKWGFFPSFALGWVLTEESFVKKLNWFDELKLRLGYGSVGNQNIPLYMYLNRYYPDGSSGNLTFKLDPTMGNPLITWEKQNQFNIGLDGTALKNKLRFTLEYFKTVNDDLLMSKPLSPSTGFKNVISNVGKLENQGVELTLGADLIKTKDLSWSINATLSKDKNIVKALYGNVDAIYNIPDANTGIISRTGNFFVGESINSIYSYKFQKICQAEDMVWVSKINYQGRIVKPGDIVPLDINDDKIIDDKDRTVIGKMDPDFYGGFSSDIKYKDFSLSAVFNYSVGAKRISWLYESMMSGTGLSVAHEDMNNRWTSQNTQTNIPRAYYSLGARYQLSDVDWGLQDASYLKMSTITFSYNLPKSIASKLSLNDVRLYFTGSNLLTITHYKGYDPEWGDNYPSSRMYVIGFNINF